jgi:hypothetical protein
MKHEQLCQLVLAGSQRHWAGPGSILNFWIFESKLQNFVHPSIHPSEREIRMWTLKPLALVYK